MSKKKKILVTGSCGFIFSNFMRYAITQHDVNYKFISVDKVKSSRVMYNVFSNKNHTFHIGDVADSHFMDVVFQTEEPDIVIHAAAESFVDSSIKNANPFIHSNVQGTQTVIDACVKWGVERLMYVSCYDEETKAVTKNGIKSFDKLNIGDYVLSINPNTGLIEEKKIEKIIVQDYDGEMLEFKNKRIDLKVTPNHRMIYSKKSVGENLSLFWNEAVDLNGKNEYLPRGRTHKKTIENTYIKNIGYVDSEALYYVSGFFIADGFLAFQKKTVKNKSGYKRNEFLKRARDDKGQFCIIKGGPEKESVCHSHRIFFDVPENDKGRKKLEKCLNKLNIKYTAQKNKSGEHIYFSSKEWSNYFKQFGKCAKNKTIPTWMLNTQNYNLLHELWHGIHDGDGHGYNIRGRTVRITTVSENLKDKLCYLGSCIGMQTSFEKRYNESFLNKRKISGWCYIVYFSSERRVKLPSYKKTKYSGKIWCLKVEDNKNFLVERNGKTAFSGNTDEIYGQLTSEEDPPWPETAPMNPRNPYSATKAAGELLVKAAHQTHGLNYNITRCCNNYGPRQDPEKFIPKIIKCVINNEKIPVYGQGRQVRDWLYVSDNCRAVLDILEKGTINETYNIAANQEYSNIEICQLVCNTLGKGHDLIEFVEDRPGHDFRYSVDCTKLKSIGWEPEFKFKQGLEETAKWYINNKSWFLK